MNKYRYKLEVYNGAKTRYHCPKCQKRDKSYTLYIDTETGDYIHTSVGRCNRENNCGYHYTPAQYFKHNNMPFCRQSPKVDKLQAAIELPTGISFISDYLFKESINSAINEPNNLVSFFMNHFGTQKASELVRRYFLSTSRYWLGDTVFWQIDTQGKVRSGKIMLYNPITGKRVKTPFNHFQWIHNVLKLPNFKLKQCLFGEHLLIDKMKPVAIVESEKTAIIASVYLPQFIWLATGGIAFNPDKCSVLRGHNVTLFPDINAFDKWNEKAKELSSIARITVSNLLENKATDRERCDGLDLADYLLRFNYKEFVKPKINLTDTISSIFSLPNENRIMSPEPVNYHIHTEKASSESLSQEIFELENYFSSAVLPSNSFRLNSFSTITDCSLFVESHFSTLHQYNGKGTFMPFLSRLNDLRSILDADSNTDQSF